ncbi:hypothetical protein CVT26_010176 [Gymnopilus dilepis]|uniref:Uncharacterized protein n=1 Tax=Gymnopilus dilepis TaxID=231916 RepID=A0A409WCV1_9AGAR|nr:hypothetical protein CVT26_010176 [Gymnopilus dilepis]
MAAKAPQSKVKTSLRGFAMRKRKQKEKEAELEKAKDKDFGEEKVEEKDESGKGKPNVVDTIMASVSPTTSASVATTAAGGSTIDASLPTTTGSPTTPAFGPSVRLCSHLSLASLHLERSFQRIPGASFLQSSRRLCSSPLFTRHSLGRRRLRRPPVFVVIAAKLKDANVQGNTRSQAPVLSRPAVKARQTKPRPQRRPQPPAECPSSQQKPGWAAEARETKKEAVETSLTLSAPTSISAPAPGSGVVKNGWKETEKQLNLAVPTKAASNIAGALAVKDVLGEGKEEADKKI